MNKTIKLQISSPNEFNKEEATPYGSYVCGLFDDLFSPYKYYDSKYCDAMCELGEVTDGEFILWTNIKNGVTQVNDNDRYIGYISGVKKDITQPIQTNLTLETLIHATLIAIINEDSKKSIHEKMIIALESYKETDFKKDLESLINLFKEVDDKCYDHSYIDSLKGQINDLNNRAIFYVDKHKSRVLQIADKNQFDNFKAETKDKIDNIAICLSKYQLSLYMYALAQYLSIRINNNTNKDYLDGVIAQLENQALEYKDICAAIYNNVKTLSDNKDNKLLLESLDSIYRYTLNLLTHTPNVFDDGCEYMEIDGPEDCEYEKIGPYNILEELTAKQYQDVSPYIDAIKTINHIYNSEIKIGADGINIYVSK